MKPVRVHDEPAEVRLLEDVLEPGHVAAFREPDADRVATEASRDNGRAR